MRILLALGRKDVREMVSFSLEGRFGAEVHSADTAQAFIERSSFFSQCDLAICEMPGLGEAILRHSVLSKLPMILCSSQETQAADLPPGVKMIASVRWERLVDGLFKVISEWRPGENQDSEFCRIKTNLLLRVSPLKGDIYIRLSPSKYLRLFREGDVFDENDYKRYLVEKRLEYFYLKKDECGEFIQKFRHDLAELLSQPGPSDQAIEELSISAHETIQGLIEKLGPTKEVQETVKASVQLALRAARRSPRVEQILERLSQNPSKYIPAHSFLLSQLASSISIAMGWGSDTTLQKLNLAAFLHDITLSNHRLATVKSLPELDRRKDEFSDQELHAYKVHPNKGSEIARQFSECPPDVDVIIAQHHERPDGSGFPRGLTHPNISPLAGVFIVAHELVSSIIENGQSFFMEEFLESIKDRYEVGNFKKILAVLRDQGRSI